MHKLTNLIIWACLSGGIALASCSGASNDISFETRVDSCAFLTPDFYGDSVYSIATYSIVWPTKLPDVELKDMHDSLMSVAFDTISQDLNEAVKHFLRTGAIDARQMALEPVSMSAARSSDKCNELVINEYVSMLTPTLMVMGIDIYGYFFGAAHGYGTSNYINYSITEHCQLTDHNLFETDRIQDVIDIVKTTAKERYPNGDVNVDDIDSVNTFRITPRQIVFVFQPYDIAPYYMGVIEIPVNTYDLYEVLTPLGHKVLGL